MSYNTDYLFMTKAVPLCSSAFSPFFEGFNTRNLDTSFLAGQILNGMGFPSCVGEGGEGGEGGAGQRTHYISSSPVLNTPVLAFFEAFSGLPIEMPLYQGYETSTEREAFYEPIAACTDEEAGSVVQELIEFEVVEPESLELPEEEGTSEELSQEGPNYDSAEADLGNQGAGNDDSESEDERQEEKSFELLNLE
ncbi:MAG: hypothetical protein JSS62_06020 [Verrucomicrobia bacterium]|nr:hypothetical protein [Verrucomicrobiota bacterium]MBS0647094.1 hypothetical protein [Verrucomicrobiota bacterium]